jgi:predicted DNA binding protein
MHQFVVDHDEYTVARLLYYHQYAEGEFALLFHIEGPVDPYREVIDDQVSVLEFEIASCADESFYIYAREEMTSPDRAFIDAFAQPGLLRTHPVEYRADETTRIVVLGPTAAIQSAADTVSERSEIDVVTVGDFRSSRVDPRLGVTQRQFEAVTAAVEAGYYNVPRAASIDDVATQLDCSSGTAGELLRRAEQTVMSSLVPGGPFQL